MPLICRPPLCAVRICCQRHLPAASPNTAPRAKDQLQPFTDAQMLTCSHTPGLTLGLTSSQHDCPLVVSHLTPPGPVKSESLGLEHCNFLQAPQGNQEGKLSAHMPGLQSLYLRAMQVVRFSDICHLDTRQLPLTTQEVYFLCHFQSSEEHGVRTIAHCLPLVPGEVLSKHCLI